MNKPVIVVLRLGSLGDVALLIPVIELVARLNPEYQFHFITKKQWIKIIPTDSSFTTSGLDFEGEFKGPNGIIKLWKFIQSLTPIFLADMHDVFRTKIVRNLLKLNGVKTNTIDKGRNEKLALTRQTDKTLTPLKHATKRYMDVFKHAKLNLTLDELDVLIPLKPRNKIIGIAPFAKWPQKIYPLHQMKTLADMLTRAGYKIFVFGYGEKEKSEVEPWAITNTQISLSFHKSFSEELKDMKSCDLLVCMDSANLHIASLYKIPTVSIWGPTHPYLGFTGYNQSEDSIVQNSNISCRPCSVFGNKKCFQPEQICLTSIQPQEVFDRIQAIIE